MLRRRRLFQSAGVAAVAWKTYGAVRSSALSGGPFGVVNVAGPLKIRATLTSFAFMPEGNQRHKKESICTTKT